MAKFRDLMQAFLYQEVDEKDDIEETEEEEIALSQPEQPAEPVAQPAVQTVAEAAVQAEEPVQMPEEMVYEEEIAVQAVEPASPTSFLDAITEMDEPVAVEKKRTRPVRRSRSNNGVQEEYKAVISPIFGNLHDHEKEYESVHDAINLPKPEDGLELVQIVSPMFGRPKANKAVKKQPDEYTASVFARQKKAAPRPEVTEAAPAAAAPAAEAAPEAGVTEEAQPAKAPASLQDYLTRDVKRTNGKDSHHYHKNGKGKK